MARRVHRRDRRQIDPSLNPANAPCFPESVNVSVGPTYLTVTFNVTPSARVTATSDPAALIDWFVLAYIDAGMGYSLQALPVTSIYATPVGPGVVNVGLTADIGSATADVTTKPWLACIPEGQSLIQTDFGGPVVGGLDGFGPVGAFIGRLPA